MRTKIMLAVSNLILLSLLISSWSNAGKEKTQLQQQFEDCVPQTPISPEAARVLSSFYGSDLRRVRNPLSRINPVGRIETDARSTWYSLDALQKYICWIQGTLQSNGCNDLMKKNLGIRFYYGRYPNITANPNGNRVAMEMNSVPDRYAFHHTLFLVPTFDDKKNVHVDFDPTWSTSCSPTTFRDILSDTSKLSKKTSAIIILHNVSQTQDDVNIQNHGNLSPPDNLDGSAFINYHQ